MATKAEINRFRRMAARRGYRLEKTRRRDPEAVDFDGFMVTDFRTKCVVLGGPVNGFAYSASLADVAAFFRSEMKVYYFEEVKLTPVIVNGRWPCPNGCGGEMKWTGDWNPTNEGIYHHRCTVGGDKFGKDHCRDIALHGAHYD